MSSSGLAGFSFAARFSTASPLLLAVPFNDGAWRSSFAYKLAQFIRNSALVSGTFAAWSSTFSASCSLAVLQMNDEQVLVAAQRTRRALDGRLRRVDRLSCPCPAANKPVPAARTYSPEAPGIAAAFFSSSSAFSGCFAADSGASVRATSSSLAGIVQRRLGEFLQRQFLALVQVIYHRLRVMRVRFDSLFIRLLRRMAAPPAGSVPSAV